MLQAGELWTSPVVVKEDEESYGTRIISVMDLVETIVSLLSYNKKCRQSQ